MIQPVKKMLIGLITLSIISSLGYWGYFEYSNYLADKRGEVLYRKGQEKPKYTKIVKLSKVEMEKIALQPIDDSKKEIHTLKKMQGKSGRAKWDDQKEQSDYSSSSTVGFFPYCPFKEMIAFYQVSGHSIYFKSYKNLSINYIISLSKNNELVNIRSMACSENTIKVITAGGGDLHIIDTSSFPPIYRGMAMRKYEKTTGREFESGHGVYQGILDVEHGQFYKTATLRDDISLRVEQRSKKIDDGDTYFFSKVYFDKLNEEGAVVESRLVIDTSRPDW